MIRVTDLTYRVGRFALQDVSLHVASGEYFVLLGPSGAGKTLLLESICGLRRPAQGRIEIGGSDVTGSPPRRRRLGYLPQDYALFPHLSVRRNVLFAARYRGGSRRQRRRRADELLEQLGLAPLAERPIAGLSGGERQRTALARALAAAPRALLLDEPVSALDEETRDVVCRQLKDLQRRTGAAMLHVCHNFAEMLAVADRAAVLLNGRIVQTGPPAEILERPCNAAVARFVQAGNLWPAELSRDGSWLRLQCGPLRLRAPRAPAAPPPAQPVLAMIRPENLVVLSQQEPAADPGQQLIGAGVLHQVRDAGALVRIAVRCDSHLTALAAVSKREFRRRPVRPGDPVRLAVAPEDVHVVPADG